MKQIETQQQQDPSPNPESSNEAEAKQGTASKARGWIVILILLLLLLAGIAAGGYFGWQYFSQYQSKTQQTISELEAQLVARPTRAELEQSLRPVQEFASQSDSRIAALKQEQESLLQSTEKLYELYGRDENGWKLAEVEYLMSIAQHKLLLEQDFEGAAMTLDAASSRIAELADPGLLPVRLLINDEVAALKTRARPDLVGMTLTLARLTRQLAVLQPGYVARETTRSSEDETAQVEVTDPDRSWQQRALDFATSLVTIKRKTSRVEQTEAAQIIDVQQKLEESLKLTRWSVLERDAHQYKRLMEQNITLFSQYYDLEVGANADFHAALLKLQKSSLKPEFPDISGSLYLLREIRKKREQAPQQEAEHG